MADDEQGRRGRAERLRREIDALRSGAGEKRKPGSPREFLNERAREEMARQRFAEETEEDGAREDEQQGDDG